MELSRKVASAITTYAQNNRVDVIVFEYLEMKGKQPGKETEASFVEKTGYSEAM